MRPLLLACMILALPLGVVAQTVEEQIAKAILPLPDDLKEGATVVIHDADGHERVIREGTNAMICVPNRPYRAFTVQCFDRGSEVFQRAVYGLMAQGGGFASVMAGLEDGTVPRPNPGAIEILMTGPDQDRAKTLFVTYLPDATAESTGLPTELSRVHPWLMCPGTPLAHVMFGDPAYGMTDDVAQNCGQ